MKGKNNNVVLSEVLQEALNNSIDYVISHGLTEISPCVLVYHVLGAQLRRMSLNVEVSAEMADIRDVINKFGVEHTISLSGQLLEMSERSDKAGALDNQEKIQFDNNLAALMDCARANINSINDCLGLNGLNPEVKKVFNGDGCINFFNIIDAIEDIKNETQYLKELATILEVSGFKKAVDDVILSITSSPDENGTAKLRTAEYKPKEVANPFKNLPTDPEPELPQSSKPSEEDDDRDGLELNGDKQDLNTMPVDPNSDTPTLDRYAINLVNVANEGGFDPVVGREKELEQIIEILCCRKKNNVVLTGDPGCGKTAIIEQLACCIATGQVPLALQDKKLFSLDLNALVAGTSYRGQYEKRLQDVIKEVTTQKNIIIYIDELHNLIGNGSSSGTGDAANILKPYLARGEFQCIGSTTTDEYRKHIEKDGALKRRFSQVFVEEPSVEDTIKILEGIKDVYGKYHHVTYKDGVIEKCVKLSGKYINDRFFPDKAISVLDMASSLAKLEDPSSEIEARNQLNEIKRQMDKVAQDRHSALIGTDFDLATKLRDQLRSMKDQYANKEQEIYDNIAAHEVTEKHISSVISKISNVPVDKIMSSDIENVRSMKKELESKIIGQDEAVKELTIALQRNIFGLRDQNKPIASFLLVGPTGVGKSLISKLVAKEFMGSENNLITIACSEYMQDWAESKLLGSAPGYVGFSDSEPRLYVLKRKPYSVILIDEVEKSSNNLYNIWLNMLEEGEVTLSSGEKVSCRNSIIIFTGNVGTKSLEMQGNGIGFDTPNGEQKRLRDTATVMREVSKEFRPEFLNRLSKIIVFNSLGKEELDKIFWLETGKLQERVRENLGFTIIITDRVKDVIVSKCEPKYGARSLQRLITEYIEDSINSAMLEQEIANKSQLTVDIEEGQTSSDKVTVTFI